jgi:ATP-binding cassette subfamily F protein uup
VETLELLEELLLEYQGTLLLVSHDRAFLDNAVTSTLVFEGGGRIGEYVGGYTDWLRQKKPAAKPASSAKTARPAVAAETPRAKSRKLSYKDQRELEALPGKIEALESEQSRLQTSVSHAGFYQQPGEVIAATLARLQTVTTELEGCYARWEILEAQLTATDG